MQKKILVTGATGNVGGEVVKQLAARGVAVKAATRNLAKAESMGWKDVEVVLFDYDKPETFEAALAGAERVFMVPPPVNPRQHEMLIPLIDKASQSGVHHIVNLSAMGVEQDDELPLRMVEKHLEESGIQYTLLRPNWFMQNCNEALLESIRGEGGIYLPAGDSKTSFIDVRDIAAVAVAALTTNEFQNQAYVLTGGRAFDHHEMAKMLSDVSGRDIRYAAISDDDTRTMLKSVELPDESIRMILGLYQFVRQGGTEAVSPDVANILGREPITFEQYARDYADCWK